MLKLTWKYATKLHKTGIVEYEMMEDGSPSLLVGEVFWLKNQMNKDVVIEG